MKKTLIASLLAFGAMAAAHAKDIVDTAVSAGSFKTLVTAVQAAGLVDTLKGPGPFTVFAPSDEAFAKIPKDQLDALLKDKAKLTAVLSVVAWRLFWSAMVARAAPYAPARVALTEDEVAALDAAVPDGPQPGITACRGESPAKTLGVYLLKVARLGGHLGRNRDPPPGNTVMWRGWSRLADIALGHRLARGCR